MTILAEYSYKYALVELVGWTWLEYSHGARQKWLEAAEATQSHRLLHATAWGRSWPAGWWGRQLRLSTVAHTACMCRLKPA